MKRGRCESKLCMLDAIHRMYHNDYASLDDHFTISEIAVAAKVTEKQANELCQELTKQGFLFVIEDAFTLYPLYGIAIRPLYNTPV
jgi:hypothetical protein